MSRNFSHEWFQHTGVWDIPARFLGYPGASVFLVQVHRTGYFLHWSPPHHSPALADSGVSKQVAQSLHLTCASVTSPY